MTVLSPQVERSLTRPWATATALAALFVALEGLTSGVTLVVFFISPGVDFGDGSLRWEILRSEWSFYLAHLLIGLGAAYVLRLAVQSDVSFAWPRMVLRAVILYIPTSIAIHFVVAFFFALLHNESFQFFGFEVLG